MRNLSELSLCVFPDVSGVDRVEPEPLIRVVSENQPQSFTDISRIRSCANENPLVGQQRTEGPEYKLRCDTKVFNHL